MRLVYFHADVCRWILVPAAAAVLAPAGSTAAGSRSYWEALEGECRGDLACMLRVVEAAEPIPHWRADRSAGDLVRALRKAGRFPRLGLSEEEGAAVIFQDLLPGRTIYPIDATGIIESGGAWHCVTMEYPRPGNSR